MKKKGRAKRKEKPCNCAGCLGLPSADPIWGFDLSKVHETECTHCNTPIGGEPYILDCALARFGTMLFIHERCSANRDQDRKDAAGIAWRWGFAHATAAPRPRRSQNVLSA